MSIATTHQGLTDLMTKLERLKATADLLEEEIERDVKQLSEKWGIDDVEQALESIQSITKSAEQHAANRDSAIAQAAKILTGIEEKE